MARSAAESLEIAVMSVALVVIESQEQCVKCKMVFALSPLDETSGVKAKDRLRDEPERHVQQNHMDLPSAWRPEDQSINLSKVGAVTRRCLLSVSGCSSTDRQPNR